MRSIERRFKIEQKKKPDLGTILCFSAAVRKQNFSRSIIARWFNKLVDKDDFSCKDKKAILHHLVKLSKEAEEGKKQHVFAFKPLLSV